MGEMKRAVARYRAEYDARGEQDRKNNKRFTSTVVNAAAIVAAVRLSASFAFFPMLIFSYWFRDPLRRSDPHCLPYSDAILQSEHDVPRTGPRSRQGILASQAEGGTLKAKWIPNGLLK